MKKDSIRFRFAERKDVALVYYFIKKLAAYEKMSDAVKATEKSIEEWMFDKNRAEVLFIMDGDLEVGFSLFYESFSAYTGSGGIFIDDLYVEDEYRGKGYGKVLLQKMAEITFERDCDRLEWLCLKDNYPSIKFYQHMGATLTEECRVFRATGEVLKRMIEK